MTLTLSRAIEKHLASDEARAAYGFAMDTDGAHHAEGAAASPPISALAPSQLSFHVKLVGMSGTTNTITTVEAFRLMSTTGDDTISTVPISRCERPAAPAPTHANDLPHPPPAARGLIMSR